MKYSCQTNLQETKIVPIVWKLSTVCLADVFHTEYIVIKCKFFVLPHHNGHFHTRDGKLIWDGFSVSDEFPVLAWKQDGYNFRRVTHLILSVYFSVALDGFLRRVLVLEIRKGDRASASKWNWQVVRLISNSHWDEKPVRWVFRQDEFPVSSVKMANTKPFTFTTHFYFTTLGPRGIL